MSAPAEPQRRSRGADPRLTSPALIDIVVAAALAIYGAALLTDQPGAVTRGSVAALLAVAGIVVVRRIAPISVLVALLVVRLLQDIDGGGEAYVTMALSIALFTLAHRHRLIVVVAMTLTTVIAFLLTAGGLDPLGVALIGSTVGFFSAAAACGAALRRVDRVNRELDQALVDLRETAAFRERAIVLADRDRIRGDLHDIVGHHVNVALVVAQAARSTSHGGTDDAFSTIETTCRNALDEMDRTTDTLADIDTGSIARIEDYAGVIGDLRRAGFDIRIEHTPPAEELATLDPAVSSAAMRFFQEAITNVIKHAHPKRAAIRIDMLDSLIIEIDSHSAPTDTTRHRETPSSERLERYLSTVGGTMNMGATATGFRQAVRFETSDG